MRPALLVVDVQQIYTAPKSEMYCRRAGDTITKINRLIQTFSQEGWPIVFIRHIHKADGSDTGRMFDYTGEPAEDFNFKAGTPEVEYDRRLAIPKTALHITKTRYSAFAQTDLQAELQRLQVDTVVVCGFMTNFCCDSTAREAHDRDFFVDFIKDATGTPGIDSMDQKQIREAVGNFLSEGYARVHTTADYIAQL
jgi:ureidoacrylate peracid hydrolase